MINFVRCRAPRVHRLIRRGIMLLRVRHIGARKERSAGQYRGSHVRDRGTWKYRVPLKREIFSSIYFKYREPCAMPTVYAYPREITRNRSYVLFSLPHLSRIRRSKYIIYKRQSLAVKIRELVPLLLSEVLVLQQVCMLDFVLCIRLSTFTSGKPIMLPAFFAVSARLRFSLYFMQTREFHFNKTNRFRLQAFGFDRMNISSAVAAMHHNNVFYLLIPLSLDELERASIAQPAAGATATHTHGRARICMYINLQQTQQRIPSGIIFFVSTIIFLEAIASLNWIIISRVKKEPSHNWQDAGDDHVFHPVNSIKTENVEILPFHELSANYKNEALASQERHRSRAKGIYHRSRGVGSREHRIICCIYIHPHGRLRSITT
uniref:Uncharacterized protein n=1 Tax=Trichogramma kaykai TaxID=54128 RepID=A0ABD2WCC8_9HYME